MTKNVWITGASSGIGKALAIKFASEGWHVAASARRENLLQELNKENPNILSFPLDVTDGPLCKKIFNNNPIKNFAIVGGVSANRYINKSFKNLCKEFNKNFVEVELKYSADNAAMIGRWAIEAYKNKNFSNLDEIKVQASKKCEAGSFL